MKEAFATGGKTFAGRRVKYERALDGGFDLQTRQKLFFARHNEEKRRLPAMWGGQARTAPSACKIHDSIPGSGRRERVSTRVDRFSIETNGKNLSGASGARPPSAG